VRECNFGAKRRMMRRLGCRVVVRHHCLIVKTSREMKEEDREEL
jgi:hypothetical protein